MKLAWLQDLAAEIQAAGGIVTAEDLVGAQPTVKQPITAQVVLHPLHPPPPSPFKYTASSVCRPIHLIPGLEKALW